MDLHFKNVYIVHLLIVNLLKYCKKRQKMDDLNIDISVLEALQKEMDEAMDSAPTTAFPATTTIPAPVGRTGGSSSLPSSTLKKDVLENAFKKNRKEERYVFRKSLEFVAVKDHILESLCRHPVEDEPDSSAGDCQLCRFEKGLSLPHLPEMIFPHNRLTISHQGRLLVDFNAFDALRRVDTTQLPTIQVGPSTVWQSARQEMPSRQFQQPFDWTYTSDYRGTLGEGVHVKRAEESSDDVLINYERLKRKDPIQFYSQLTLYEDELADNGCAQMIVRVRVMPDTFLLLCRFYLRVDHVMVRICDTRLYGEAENVEFAVREWSQREANYADLGKEALDSVLDPNLLFAHLPLINSETERIYYPTAATTTVDDEDGSDGK